MVNFFQSYSRSCFSTSVPWLQTDSAVLAAAISDSERDRCESLQMFAAHVNWGSPWTINSKVCSDIIRKAFFLYFWYSEWFWNIFCYSWSWKTFCCTAVRRITETAPRPLTISPVSVWRLVRCFEFVSDRLIQEGEWLPKIFDSSLRRGKASADLHITTGVSREVIIDTVTLEFAVST